MLTGLRWLVGFVAVCAVAGEAPWTAQYQADGPPAKSTPRFHVLLAKGASAEVAGGVLRLTSAPEPKAHAFIGVGQSRPSRWSPEPRWGECTAWDGSRPAVVEARMRVVRVLGDCKLGAMIQASDGRRYWLLCIAPGGLARPDGRVVHKLDATQFHIYRIALEGGKATATVDGAGVPPTVLAEGKCRRNAVMFGDLSSAVAGVSEWDFIRWRSEKAKPWKELIVPEFWSSDKVEMCSPKCDHPFAATVRAETLANGRVMITYYGPANPHGQKPGTCRLYARVSADGGRTWGDERAIVHHAECQACEGSLLRTRDGTMWAFYLGFHIHAWKDGEPLMDKTRSDLWAASSTDNGATWANKQMIFRGYTGSTNGALQTSKGHILVPFSYVVPKPGRLVSACCVSADGGKTWTLSSHLDIGGHGDHAGALEPTVVELKDGRIWMLIRNSNGCFFESFSSDNGLTWTEPKRTPIKSPSAPGHITRLASGRLAFAWNNTMATTKGRDTLSVALSDDEGKTWTKPMECVRSGQLSYPNITEVAPGMLLITCQHIMRGWGKAAPVAFRVSEKTLLEHK